jgi:hypothetical protein
MDGLMPTLNDLYKQGRMTWMEQGKGWVGRPEEVLGALATDGFYECQRGRTTSPSERQLTELWTIAVILLVLWALGMISSYSAGGLVHLLLVVAVIVVVFQFLGGRRSV